MTFRNPGLHLGVIALTLALAYGIWYAYSVFLVALLQDFGWKRSVLAGAFSIFALVQGALNPLLGVLCDRLRPASLVGLGGLLLSIALYTDSFIREPWQLYLSFGLLTAAGVALCGWVPAVVMVQRRYAHRLGLALGIISAGVGVGMVVVVPVCQWLIDLQGWRLAFRWLGTATLLWVVPAALFLFRTDAPPRSRRPGNAAADARGPTLSEALRAPAFWLLLLAFFCGTYCSQTLHVHQVAFLVDHGISAMQAASVVGLVGFASIFGKIGGGWLSDRFKRERVYCAFVAVLVLSVAALYLVGITSSAWGVPAYAVMLGLGYSATAALMPAMMSDRFSGPHFGTLVGLGLLASATGSASGPWLAGYLFDHQGTYTAALAVAMVVGGIACACGWLVGRPQAIPRAVS